MTTPIDVTFLGTGSALPSPSRLQTGIVLNRGGEHLLVDCGSGVTHRLAQAGIDYRTIDTMLLTHHHLDHVADLPTLAKAGSLKGYDDFHVVGPSGTRDICTCLFSVDDLNERVNLEITELSSDTTPFTLEPYDINRAETVHSNYIFAYRFCDALTISGDTSPTSAVTELADGSNTHIPECAYSDGVETDGHTTPIDLGNALAGVDVKEVFLTHLFPKTEDNATDLARTVAEYTDASVHVAKDLDTMTIE